jgi:hypothetical protein
VSLEEKPMHPVRTTLTSTTNPLVLVVLVWALLWGYGATQVAMPGDGHPHGHGAEARVLAELEADTVWESTWSQRFPGCVALALWPQHESPVALVTRTSDGRVDKVAPAAVEQQPGRVVGACR